MNTEKMQKLHEALIDPPTIEEVAAQTGLNDTHLYAERTSQQKRQTALFGALCVTAAAGLVATRYLDRSGEISYYSSGSNSPALTEQVRIGSFNMHNEAAKRYKQIDRFGTVNHLSAIALQEVSKNDADSLKHLLPKWRFTYFLADRKQRPLEGGYGNAIMTRQNVTYKKSKVIAGTGPLETTVGVTTGAVQDAYESASTQSITFKKTTDGRQEDRVAGVVEVPFKYKNKTEHLRVATAHIAGKPSLELHNKQLKEVVTWVSEQKKKDMPLIFMGDLNEEDSAVIRAFNSVNMIGDHTLMRTTTDMSARDIKIDHEAYADGSKLDLPVVRVDKRFKTDHYAVVAVFSPLP